MNRTKSAAVSIALLSLLAIGPTRPAGAVARIDHEAECTWRPITWDDFRGPVVDSQETVHIVATIVLRPVQVEMVETAEGGATARAREPVVYALMDKLASYARPEARTEHNLAYEQIHFDLTELLARRLTRELREMEIKGEAKSQELQRTFLLAVERRYAETMTELDRLQSECSRDTAHGTRGGPQGKWSAKVAKLLASEAPYELR